jgi:hypothetical protein
VNLNADLIHQLLAHGGQSEVAAASAPAADGDQDVEALAGLIRTKESHDFLHGGREMPLPALLSRVLLSLGGDSSGLASQVQVVLGVRETEPSKVMWSSLSQESVRAIAAAEVMVDGDQFFLEEGGHLVAHRLLPIRNRRPELFLAGWRVQESSWGRVGALKINWTLDTDADGPVPMMEYGLDPAAVWRAPKFEGGLAGPCELGTEHVLLQVLLIASGSTSPLREQLLAAGLIQEGQVALALVALPSLAPLSRLTAGPAANNVLGSELDGPFSGSQSPYSAWSSLAAKQLVDEWGLENGSTSAIENLDGVSRMLDEALGGILEGGLVGEGSAERSYGIALAEWIAGSYSPGSEVGAGLVREVITRREKGESYTLEVRTEGNITGLAVVEIGADGAVTREQRLF